ncbi:MAG: EAL domain-containing protein [Magnetococcales bacterium]|nr:EAL domain-containing protein [Magnetococcales bacterium]
MKKKPIIFVVDDDGVTRLMLSRFLEKCGYHVVGLANGADAVEAFDSGLPDIVLMDANMPIMNGFDACAAMKARPDAQHIPVLMITGLNDDESVDRAYTVGAADFITKPVHWAILRNRVRYLLKDLEAERKLYLASSVFDSTNEGIVVTDQDAVIQSINPAFTHITGYTAEEALGNSMKMIQSDRHDQAFYHKFWETLNDTGKWQGEFWSRRKDGRVYPQWLTISTIRGPQGTVQNIVGVFSDLTALKESEESLLHMLGHDPLTDLPNRHLFQERLSFALNNAQGREEELVTILLLDLDRFKVINDTMGHDVGDHLLIQTGNRIAGLLASYQHQIGSGLLGRLGGDEFGIILPNLSQTQEAAQFAKDLLELFAKPFVIDSMEYFIGVSIGIGIAPLDGQDVLTLMKNTDAAMYHAKEQGRNNFQFYRTDLNTFSMARMLMERELRNALDRNEFLMYFQPQMDLKTGRLVGAEALIRWLHPQQGMVSPGAFIPLAEEIGLITPMGSWALASVCRQSKLWWDSGLPPLRIAVNLSGIQFRQPNFVETVIGILSASGLDARYLELELTESIAMGDVEGTFAKLKMLSDAQIKLAIDDFGTGFSSLSYLKRFPIDTLKIDQSFVRQCTENTEDAAVIRAFISLAHSLGLSVIAEGVETKEQLQFLEQEGCDEIQGYWYGRPMPAAQFLEFMRNSAGQQNAEPG